MRTYQQWQLYRELELISDLDLEWQTAKAALFPPPPCVRSRLQSLWQRFITYWSTSSEPQIQETVDATGRRWWSVYDPKTHQTVRLNSLQDVLVWLEERHP